MKILIAVDGSRFAEEILAELSRLTWPKDSFFRIITTVEKTSSWETEKQYLEQGTVILNDRIQWLKNHMNGVDVSGEVMIGSAQSMITQEARAWQADLIVIGSHGDTGIRRDRIGSVAAAVANTAPCSVEIIKVGKTHKTHSDTTAALNEISSAPVL